MVSPKGTLLHADVKGQVVVRAQLSGMPECRFGINDRLMIEAENQQGYRTYAAVLVVRYVLVVGRVFFVVHLVFRTHVLNALTLWMLPDLSLGNCTLTEGGMEGRGSTGKH
jgi:uncharacterized ion transporter superfamily protein YfcC